MAHFEVYLSDGRTERFEFGKRSLTIGRSTQADIRIQEAAISRMHARLERTDAGRWILVDLESRNHVYCQGKRIKSYVLTNGDTVNFGSIKAVFHDASGQSDTPAEQMTPPKSAKRKPPRDDLSCPSCMVPIREGVEICVNCGYNFRTGTKLRTVQEVSSGTRSMSAMSGTGMQPAPATSTAAAAKAPAKPAVNIDTELIIQWVLPATLILLFLIVAFVKGGAIGGVGHVIGLVFRVIFMLVAMAIAAKVAKFGFGYFGQAILKVFGICGWLAIVSIAVENWSFAVYLVLFFGTLGGLLYLFFDLDVLKMFLIVAVVGLLQIFLFNEMMDFLKTSLHIVQSSADAPV